jgi:hypothetical protein
MEDSFIAFVDTYILELKTTQQTNIGFLLSNIAFVLRFEMSEEEADFLFGACCEYIYRVKESEYDISPSNIKQTIAAIFLLAMKFFHDDYDVPIATWEFITRTNNLRTTEREIIRAINYELFI